MGLAYWYRKLIHLRLISLFSLGLLLQLWSNPDFLRQGNNAYEQKNYLQAIELFKQALVADIKKYGAVANYKIALAHIKLKSCHQAREFFIAAYKAEPEKAGASSKEKFIEKIHECGFSLEEIQLKSPNLSVAEKEQAENQTNSESQKRPTLQGTPLEEKKEEDKKIPWYYYLIGGGGLGGLGYFAYNRFRSRDDSAASLNQQTGYDARTPSAGANLTNSNQEFSSGSPIVSDFSDHS